MGVNRGRGESGKNSTIGIKIIKYPIQLLFNVILSVKVLIHTRFSITVNIRKPDGPDFEWRQSGH
jgi:hypothetical protein